MSGMLGILGMLDMLGILGILSMLGIGYASIGRGLVSLYIEKRHLHRVTPSRESGIYNVVP